MVAYDRFLIMKAIQSTGKIDTEGRLFLDHSRDSSQYGARDYFI